MNIKNSKKILSTTVFAAIIVLLAFSVMSTTAITPDNKLVTTFGSEKGNLGDVVDVRIVVTNVGNVGDEKVQTVKVVDTLPAEFTYIADTFTVNDNAVNPDVNERENIISYDIKEIGIGTYNIKFDVKVTKAYLEDQEVDNVVEGTWYDENGNVLERITVTPESKFNIKACKLVTSLKPSEGNLGDEVKVGIKGTVEAGLEVKVVDTLPEEFTYKGNFKVENVEEAVPTVNEQVISYTIDNTAGTSPVSYEIAFDVKVTKAYWENRKVENVVEGTWYDKNGDVLQTIRVTPEPWFNIKAFTGLYEDLIEGSMEPVIGTREEWIITMGFNNIVDMKDPKITEGFGGDLKINSIKVGATTCNFKNYENYGTKNGATVDICCSKDDGKVDVCKTVPLDKRGVKQGGVHIYWTGKTHKAHFVWDISGDKTGIITFVVSTDTNPQGKQEYTSTGPHTLNSGATLTFNDKDRMELSAVAAPIEVTAVSAP
jgi:uncharacterized repeat protein (TIGR01451 family)